MGRLFKRSELSECELTTMKCIWDADEPVTCQEIMQVLREKYDLDYKDTTVYTFLKCLKQKGFVESNRKGITFYSAIRDKHEYCEGQLKKSINFWFNGSPVQIVEAVLAMDTITEEDKKAIKKLASAK